MNIIFKISWKLSFFELPLTEEEYSNFSTKVETCLKKKRYLKFFAKSGTKLVIIPYTKLKKGTITFENIPRYDNN